MTRACDVCGVKYEAKRLASRFCSPACRKRHQRNPQSAAPVVLPVIGDPGAVDGPVLSATRADLHAAGRLGGPLGQAALLLAGRLDRSEREPGTSLAALVREHRAALAEAVRGAKRAVDPVDELRARRDSRRAG